MYQRLHALKARILVVSLMFLASACVIQRANDQNKTGEEPVGAPAAPATKAEPEKAETAVVKTAPTPAAKPAPKTVAKAAPAPQTKAAAPAPAAPAAAAKATAAATAPAATKMSRVSRYVSVENLNVRSRADAHAPIVGRLVRGSMITVSVDGTWARIGDQQFVAVKHLSKNQPTGKRLVSRK